MYSCVCCWYTGAKTPLRERVLCSGPRSQKVRQASVVTQQIHTESTQYLMIVQHDERRSQCKTDLGWQQSPGINAIAPSFAA